MSRFPRPLAPLAAPSTLAEIATELWRDRLYLLGGIKRFELPPGHGNRYPAIYLTELKPVLAMVASQSALLGEAARWDGRMGKRI